MRVVKGWPQEVFVCSHRKWVEVGGSGRKCNPLQAGVRPCCLVVNANGQPNSTIRILFDKQCEMCFVLSFPLECRASTARCSLLLLFGAFFVHPLLVRRPPPLSLQLQLLCCVRCYFPNINFNFSVFRYLIIITPDVKLAVQIN